MEGTGETTEQPITLMLAKEILKKRMSKKNHFFFSPGFLKQKKRERKSREMGLIINEEWREVHDDSFFKLVFDKNKKELKSGQLGGNEELKKQREKQVKNESWRLGLEMTTCVSGPGWEWVSHRRSV